MPADFLSGVVFWRGPNRFHGGHHRFYISIIELLGAGGSPLLGSALLAKGCCKTPDFFKFRSAESKISWGKVARCVLSCRL